MNQRARTLTHDPEVTSLYRTGRPSLQAFASEIGNFALNPVVTDTHRTGRPTLAARGLEVRTLPLTPTDRTSVARGARHSGERETGNFTFNPAAGDAASRTGRPTLSSRPKPQQRDRELYL
jgi:hypothetical protein